MVCGMKTEFKHFLKAQNLSLTPVRLAVLEALHDRPHSDAASVFNMVQEKISTTSIQAIYNNLNTLAENGIIREIKPKGSVSLYETRTGDNHHHLVCRSCDHVMDTYCQGCAPCLSPADDQGFIVDEAEVIFWGTCPTCIKSNQKRRK